MLKTLRSISLTVLLLSCLSATAVTHRALIFGLGKQMDTRWSKINGDKDVQYMEKMLRTIGYTDIKSLKNEQATKAAMVKAFEDLANRCQRGDVVFIHYSGHGQLMTDVDGDEAERGNGRTAQWDEAWVPYDAYMTYCDEDHGEKHLCDDELAELLTKIRNKIGLVGKLTVAVDACHSGDATRGPEDDECVRGIDEKFTIPLDPTRTASPVKHQPERWQTISACKPHQLCTEMKGMPVGKLTYALCQLGEKAFTMTNIELQKHLNSFMEAKKGRLPQNPVVSGRR